jgi:hypothetical protein
VYDLSAKLRERGWIVPAYTLPPNADGITIMRVVRQNFSRDMADLFVEDVKKAYETLLAQRERRLIQACTVLSPTDIIAATRIAVASKTRANSWGAKGANPAVMICRIIAVRPTPSSSARLIDFLFM